MDDSVARALAYPGPMLSRAAVLTERGLDPWPSGADLPTDRPVLAIGSNASPATLRRKLIRAGVGVRVAVEPVLALGLGVAHSAHVSLGGYVAAAPFDAPHGAARGALLWLDPGQLRALDVSEPNYRRVAVSSSRYPIVSLRSAAPSRFGLYRSVWGVLADAGEPLRLGSQRRLHSILAGDRVLAERVPWHDPSAAVRALRDHRLQAWVRSYWAQRASAADAIRAVG